jgi:uncharacterized protein
MPNNNPQGRNQYSRNEDVSDQAAAHSGSAGAGSTTEAAGGAAGAASGSTSSSSAASPTDTPAGPETRTGTSRRGFASMDQQLQREIASKGGHSQGRDNNPGNFANDRDKARSAGRKGGEASGSHR